jgi:hypothetical protein
MNMIRLPEFLSSRRSEKLLCPGHWEFRDVCLAYGVPRQNQCIKNRIRLVA